MSELTTVTDATNASAATDNTPAVTAASIRRPGLFSALAVAGALALAGCGSDSGSDPEPAPEGDIDRAEVVEYDVIEIQRPQGTERYDFPSVVVYCDQFGNRVYVSEHLDGGYNGSGGAPAVVAGDCSAD